MQSFLKFVETHGSVIIAATIVMVAGLVSFTVLTIYIGIEIRAWELVNRSQEYPSFNDFNELGNLFVWWSAVAVFIGIPILSGIIEIVYRLLPSHSRSRYRRSRS